MLTKEQKDTIIEKFRTHKGDTGSSEIQIALLSGEVAGLTEHLQTHKKDHSSRRGLLRMIGKRRSLLRYLKKDDPKSYEQLSKKLKISV
ncbi:MAG: 30S ribosomal protein S15 [Candidatus Kerfeldbacteria bacterium RIFCSPHIGHO2_12_FULL_48_17]|uniref:Small ribosomal subunit protein uS15 n=1 Tax=Candidatus Kerfeldbacteria bacterium RIFCSPHIGHO2_12_FULL_48_17 TaxID=1798542 RepID=A0A1G2B283_9BACT|nr:MAG: 30S ribosomal protein S15 [Candidatus Kerfeldbacteria bacterium RIFCSPHIGHO2_12_FULL_48_17]